MNLCRCGSTTCMFCGRVVAVDGAIVESKADAARIRHETLDEVERELGLDSVAAAFASYSGLELREAIARLRGR